MYYVSPRNGYLHVEILETKQEKKEQTFLLPEGYDEVKKPYTVLKVIEDSSNTHENGTIIVVPTNVIEEIELNEQKIMLVQSNYILSVLVKING